MKIKKSNRFIATEHFAALAGKNRRRSPWPLAVVALLFIVVPFIFWYGTWFGRPLKDEEVEKYLRDDKNPRHAQHALAQLAERIVRDDESVKQWYPHVLALAESSVTDIRMTAAWVMGEDHESQEFHAALLRLIDDKEPIVRRNAALALVRFGDLRCRPELRAMLQPFSVVVSTEGQAVTVLTEGTPVKRDTMLARFKSNDGLSQEVRSPLPGKIEKSVVKEGVQIRAESELFVLAPDVDSVWEALRALYLIGEMEDVREVERYARGVEGMPDRIKQQAALAAEAIKRRAS